MRRSRCTTEGLCRGRRHQLWAEEHDERHSDGSTRRKRAVESETLRTLREVTFRAVLLPPGDTVWAFRDRPVRGISRERRPAQPGLSLRRLLVDVKSRVDLPRRK